MSRKVIQYNISSYFAQSLDGDFALVKADNEYLSCDGTPMRFGQSVLGLCLKGWLRFGYHGEEFLIREGQIFWYLPGNTVSFYESSEDYYAEIVQLSASFLRDITMRFPNVLFDYALSYPVLEMTTEAMVEAKAYFALLEAKQNEIGNLFQKDIVFNILYSFFLDMYNMINRHLQAMELTDDGELPLGKTHSDRIINRFTNLVQHHLKDNFPMTFYSEKLNITQKHLNRLVKEQKGVSVKQFVDQRRVYELKQALIRSEMSIQEISDDFHFSASDAFHHYFRKHTGMSPSQFRQQKD